MKSEQRNLAAVPSTALLADLVPSADSLAEHCIKSYFGFQVVAYTTANSMKHYSFFPWNFAIRDEFGWRHYYGIPNKVETRAKALRRAWYRAKWLHDGTYGQHYSKPFPANNAIHATTAKRWRVMAGVGGPND